MPHAMDPRLIRCAAYSRTLSQGIEIRRPWRTWEIAPTRISWYTQFRFIARNCAASRGLAKPFSTSLRSSRGAGLGGFAGTFLATVATGSELAEVNL